MQRQFKVILERDDEDGGFTVTVPELPGCITEGDSLQEALTNAQEAILCHLEALAKIGETIPGKSPTLLFTDVSVELTV